MLTPLIGSPDFALMGGRISLFKHTPDIDEQLGWYLDLWLIVEPRTDGWVVFPKHFCEASYALEGRTTQAAFQRTSLSSLYRSRPEEGRVYAPNVNETRNEIMIKGPAVLTLGGNSTGVFSADHIPTEDVEVVARMRPTHVAAPMTINLTLKRKPPDQQEVETNSSSGESMGRLATWVYGQQFAL